MEEQQQQQRSSSREFEWSCPLQQRACPFAHHTTLLLQCLLLPAAATVSPYPQNDISCGVPEGQVLALRFLPHLPADYLIQLLEKGEGVRSHNAGHTLQVTQRRSHNAGHTTRTECSTAQTGHLNCRNCTGFCTALCEIISVH